MIAPKVVMDTNVLLVSIGRKSVWHWLFRLILDKEITLLVSDSVLNEYEEKLSQKLSVGVAQNIVNVLLTASNVEWVTAYYH